MKYIVLIIFFFFFFSLESSAQNGVSAFERIGLEIKNYKLDTSKPPEDRLTEQIRKLRKVRGGFNIDEAIQFKIGEEKVKGENSKEELDSLNLYFTEGEGKQFLENAIIRIYRDHFSLKEINQLIKFYKSSAGKKLTEVFPIIMLKSLKAAEELTVEFRKNK